MIQRCLDPDESCNRTDIVARGLCSMHYQRHRYRGKLDEVAAEPTTKPCAHCGNEFSSGNRRWGAIYCSKRCDNAARYARQRKARGRRSEACEQCASPLSAGKRTHARFCSPKCGQEWRNTQVAARLVERKAAQQRLCAGCLAPIPPVRSGKALYCSEACKIRSRRHETYNLTKQELDLLLTQHARCAICGGEEWGQKGPQVDHCHTTGVVRGILCNNCNNGLGRFADDPARLRSAADYLERAQAAAPATS